MALPLTWTTVFIDLPAAGYAEAEAFWLRVLGGRLSQRRGDDGAFATFVPDTGDPYVRVQRVLDGPGGVHLDLHVPVGALNKAVDEAVGLGAEVSSREAELVVLHSPGGFPFCLVPGAGEQTVPPLLAGPGGPHRLEQVCLDIPPAGYDREVGFWAALTGWGLEPDDGSEFRGLPRPPGLPVRLLLQIMDDATSARVTAHLDFACADRHGLTPVHEAADARHPNRFEAWTTLVSPAGHVYCLTRRSPTAPPHPR